MKTRLVTLLGAGVITGCATAGSTWMAQPLTDEGSPGPAGASGTKGKPGSPSLSTHTLSDEERENGAKTLSDEPLRTVKQIGGKLEGRILGKFRNTYYDFPSESDFKGAAVALKSPSCETIKSVQRGFFEAVCVQGSGTLAGGQTVSFAKRDCACADVCPRTGQKICFDSLDPKQFPYGRGATGQPITPLLTVAVDSDAVPLGTMIYIPDFDGMPRDAESTGLHDGCFIAQDRGLRVKGQHVDVFTGDGNMTRLWNKLVPSNQGVTVVLDSPRCQRAGTETPTVAPPEAPATDKPAPKKERSNKKPKGKKSGPEE